MREQDRLAAPGTPEADLLARLDPERLPRHVAVIMDGNGRWALQRGLPRGAGHRAGADAVRELVESAARLEIEVLTLFAFSSENWRRPRAEVVTLMTLLKEYIRRERQRLIEHGIRVRVIGRIGELDPAIRRQLETLVEATAGGSGMQLNVALSYGGRAEIVDACRSILRSGMSPEELDEGRFATFLTTAGQPDPDLLVRTGGEARLSNFLLWQMAYTELRVTDALWPDFRAHHLLQALVDYQGRERRFGGVEGGGAPAPIGAGS